MSDEPQENQIPLCERCRQPMLWYRSEQVEQRAVPAIAHYYRCPGCRAVEMRTVNAPPSWH
jgi:uncharacterized protein with PIN domain